MARRPTGPKQRLRPAASARTGGRPSSPRSGQLEAGTPPTGAKAFRPTPARPSAPDVLRPATPAPTRTEEPSPSPDAPRPRSAARSVSQHLEAPGSLTSSLMPVFVDLYMQLEKSWPPLDRFIAEAFKRYVLSELGRATVTRTLHGLARHHGRLLGALGRLLEPGIDEPEPARRLQAMNAMTRVRLLVAAYLVAEEDHTPDQAAKLAGVRDPALMTTLSRLPGALAQADAVVNRALEGILPLEESLAAEGLSLPLWLARLWAEQRGWQETAAIGRALLEPPPMTLRVAPNRLTRTAALKRLQEESRIEARPTPWSPFGLTLPFRLPVERLPLFQQGLLEVQDEGSQLVSLAVGAAHGLRVLDLCAGAGGKILLVAGLQQLNGAPAETYACDPHQGRVNEMRRRLRRAGVTHVQVRVADATDPHALVDLRGRIDRILVDAPCSGLGAIRRNPEARWRLQPADLERFPPLQVQLLEKAATLLRREGRILYATCTLNRAENDAVIEAACARAGLRPAPLWDSLGSLALRLDVDPEQSRLELLPHRHGTDGFYLAALERAT